MLGLTAPRMQQSLLVLAALLRLCDAQAATALADGQIVPFTSGLPACASLCGQLSNVQGACVPPAVSAVSQSCFCSDSRLSGILQGTAGVTTVCSTGGTACTSDSDLQKIETWYEGYCGTTAASTTSSAGSTATGASSSSSSSGSTNKGWLASHYQWVIFLVVMAVGIPVVWVAAWYFRRQHIRKRDGALEKQNPIALGPHQVQGMTGGYMSSETIAGHQIVGHHPAPGMAGAYTSNATLASQTGPGAVGPSPLGRGLRKERK